MASGNFNNVNPALDPALAAFLNTINQIPDDTITMPNQPKEWTADKITTYPCYQVTELADLPIRRMSKTLSDSITENRFDDKTAYRILILALHLYHLPQGSRRRIFHRFLGVQNGLPLLDRFGAPNLELAEYSPLDITLGEKEQYEKQDRTDRLPSDMIYPGEDEIIIKYVTFLSAYLFRFLTKQVGNLDESWENMKTRFQDFYGYETPQDVKKPTEEWLKALRGAWAYDRTIQNTWIRVISEAEDNLDPNNPNLGVVRFLAIIPLSYTGMHAYKLFLQVVNITKQHPTWLLKEMLCPQTRDPLLCIAKIMTHFERTSTQNRSVGFKYARLLGSEYFPEIQTRNCPMLVYLLVAIIKLYESFENRRTNPEQIVGINNLSSELKGLLNKVANNLTLKAPLENSSWYSNSFSAAYQQVAVNPDKEIDPEIAAELFD